MRRREDESRRPTASPEPRRVGAGTRCVRVRAGAERRPPSGGRRCRRSSPLASVAFAATVVPRRSTKPTPPESRERRRGDDLPGFARSCGRDPHGKEHDRGPGRDVPAVRRSFPKLGPERFLGRNREVALGRRVGHRWHRSRSEQRASDEDGRDDPDPPFDGLPDEEGERIGDSGDPSHGGKGGEPPGDELGPAREPAQQEQARSEEITPSITNAALTAFATAAK